ncbi:uncharacterized protein [Misgurnus anguillicaudatus]|uniref:uncharacterized protein n=1 Tax=Misgurnus anguillicaudatus TaxID=75329 RepID=UPI003CCF2639
MRDLQDQNTGYYWCAVEIEGYWDVKERFDLKIQSAPDLSVMSSNVTVDEGGNISVQCLYTSTYKNKHKQFCRYKDKRCYTVGRSGTSQYSVKISDDGRGSLTVVMFGLTKSDSGWYYCSVGDLQVPVQLTVTVSEEDLQTPDEFTVTDAKSAVTTDSSSSTKDTRHIEYDGLKMWLLPIVLLLLLILVTVTSVMLRKNCRRNNNHISNEERDKAGDEDDSVNSFPVNPECDVMYSSVIKLPKTKACEPADVEKTVIYSSVCE